MSRFILSDGTSIQALTASRAAAATVAGLLGLFMLLGVGFAQVTHDVAHDSRHSVSFPCH